MSAVLDFPVKPEARPYLDAFVDSEHQPQWLREARRRGISHFAESGFPSRRTESWRYFDLQPFQQDPPPPQRWEGGLYAKWFEDQVGEQVAGLGLAAGPPRAILVNGAFFDSLPPLELQALVASSESEFAALRERSGVQPFLPAGVWFAPTLPFAQDRLRVAVDINASDSFTALNTAFFGSGYVLDVAPGVTIEEPIEIVHLATEGAAASFHTRSLIRLGAGSRASVTEIYAGQSGRYWRNDVVVVRLDAGAVLERTVLVEEAAEALHLAKTDAVLGAGARLNSFVLLLSGRRVRHEVGVRMAGEGASCRLDGAYIVTGDDEANIVTEVEHAAPGGQTRELIKGVASGRGHGAFQGKIIVREHAQKTDAHQLSRNLLIGPRAVIDTKPELEIYADDVKCSHGASVGDLDEAALFYLQARGIPAEEARHMLVDAFLREAVETVEDFAIRTHLLRRLAARLARLEGSP